MLPGQRNSDLLCAPCAGINGYQCATCGTVADKMWGLRECERCALRRRLQELLDDGTGQVAAPLVPLLEALCAPDRAPGTSEMWAHSKTVRPLLRALAQGELPLTHEAFCALPPSATVDHLRDLLMTLGILPVRDRQLLRFEQWSAHMLDGIDRDSDRRVISAYISWYHHRRLIALADTGGLTPSSPGSARQQIRAAVAFLEWMWTRQVRMVECRQVDVDAWFTSGPRHPWAARRFITWAVQQQFCPALRVPQQQKTEPQRLPRQARLALINRLLADTSLPLVDRVAGLLVLLYAQPVARISELQRSAVTVGDDGVRLRIADEDLPVPEPVGRLLANLAGIGPDRHPRTKQARSPWLFPGRRPGRPLTAKYLRVRLRAIGIRNVARAGALDELAGEVPAPVLADLTGYDPRFITRRAAQLATDWTGYASLRSGLARPS